MERGERIEVAAPPVASRKEVLGGDESDYNFEEKKLDCSDVGSPSATRQNNSTLVMASSRRTTIDYGIPSSRSRTKSWTDHRAPEPFTSPSQKPRRRKYGYGDLYRSTSSGSSAADDRIRYPHSYHSSGKAKIAFDRRRTTDARGANVQLTEKQPSFTSLDFPVLSPVKSKASSSKQEERSLTWSSVVGEDKQANENEDLHNVIPPLPFGDDVTTKPIDESKTLNVSSSALQNNSLSDTFDMGSDKWNEPKIHPRQRSQSVYSTFSFTGKTDKLPTQPPTFCTISIAALQNDIGTLLVRSNRVDEAVERYKLSIQSAKDKINDLQNKTQANDFESKLILMSNLNEQCPVQASEGLAWFRTKLLRGDVVPATANIDHQNNDEAQRSHHDQPYQPAGFGGCAPSSPRRLRSASFCVFDSRHNEHPQTPLQVHSFRRTSTPRITPKPPILPIDDIVQDIHQHQKLDCPEDVYSCNGRTPLGLEFICDPLPILGRSLRKVIVDLSDKDARVMIETAALIAATLNLAALEYRAAGGGAGDKLQQVVDTLQSCQSCFIEGECVSQSNNFFVLLKAIAHVNIGTCLYRLNKVREATQNFERARDFLLEYDADMEADTENLGNSHDDDRFPSHEYLLLVIRVNLSRAMLRLKKYQEAQKLCDEIAEDNKSHKRNSRSRLKPSPLPSHAYGFRRSNSYLATSSALETAIVAYDHETDRRSKWLFSVAEHFLIGMIREAKGDTNDQKEAWHHYNRLLSLARTKLDHRHPYICSLLERRGAVLFSQRKLQCSMLSYLACLHILEYQQSNGSNVFNQADLARVLYGIARVLHDKEEYHDALGMYHRALSCQREIANNSTRPSLDVVTTLCNISRVHHLAGDLEAALSANKEVLELATLLVGGKLDHPFLIHRLKIEGNILIEAGRLSDAMFTFVDAARRCSEDGRNRMIVTMMGGASGNDSNSQEDADAGDSSVLSVRSAATIAHSNCFHPGAAAA